MQALLLTNERMMNNEKFKVVTLIQIVKDCAVESVFSIGR